MRMPVGRVRAVRPGLGTALLVLAATGAVAPAIAQSDDDELVAIGTPRVVLTSPLPGAPYAAPASITLSATASVPSGTVQKVDFYRDSTLLDSDTAAPYAYDWTAIPAGVYNLAARARSSYGITATSVPVQVRVCDVPTVSLTAPAGGATLTTGVATSLQASAASPNGGCDITKVEFYAQLGAGTPSLVGTAVGLPPYQVDWTPSTSGGHTLTAIVYDQRNVTATSSGVAVTVNASPTVSISAPTTGQVFAPSSTVAITAVPADADGTVSKVEFYQGATLLATRTAAPWTHSWSSVPKGNYSLTAKAFDNLNATTTSAAVPIVVSQSPTVSITAPASGAVYANPANITINASAADSDGTIAKVEFFQGSTLLCTDNASPFTCAWNGVSGGSYSLTAKATDDQGATTTSVAIPIIVNQLPTVSLTSPTAGSTFIAPATVNLAATASDADGTIAQVQFYNGATLLNTDAASPFAYSWTPVAAGSYTLTAVATDNRSGSTTSAAVTITVCGPPTVSLTSPSAGTYASPANFTLSANASSACGIQKVEFYDGASLIATDSASPFSQSWNNVTTTGAHVLKARAYDNLGQFADSSTATVQVINNTAPVINSVSPSAAQVIAGGSVSFSVVVTDVDSGSTLTITLFNGSTSLTSLSGVGTGTHLLTWTPPSAGTYNLTVQVSDPYATTSQPVSVVASATPTSATPNPDVVIPGSYPTPPIGTLAGKFDVSESGAATYSIPLKVAPGTAGMEPSLSLNYSSQGSYGQLGVGFSLGGLSAITRCPMTEAQESFVKGINYDGSQVNDRWCLDGQRLVPVSSPVLIPSDPIFPIDPNGALKQEWRTELDSYVKVESFTETNPSTQTVGGPYRWRVTTKSGQLLDFASRWWVVSNGVSQLNGAPSSGHANNEKLYLLDRISDRVGNFIEIDYSNRDYEANPSDDTTWTTLYRMHNQCGVAGRGPSPLLAQPIGAYPSVEYWVSEIRYFAASSGCADEHSAVIFFYDDIPSQASAASRIRYYDQGAGQSTISRRLRAVEMRADKTYDTSGALVRSYEIDYLTSAQTGRELVSAIRECGSDDVCLPATTFNWSQETFNASGKQFANTPLAGGLPISLLPPPSHFQSVFVGDWDGDGKSDLIGWQNTFNSSTGFWDHTVRVCLSTGTGFNCTAVPAFLPFSDSSQTPSAHIEVMDIDNDGRVDVVSRQNGISTWTIWRSNGAAAATQVSGTWTTKPQDDTHPNYRGDFNGDGRIDFITWYDGQQFQTCLMGPTGFIQAPGASQPCTTQDLQIYDLGYPNASVDEQFEQNSEQSILIADVDGDGRADLVRRFKLDESSDKWKVCFSRFTANGEGDWQCHVKSVYGMKGKIENTLVYDFNGDGLADTGNFDNGLGSTRVCMSTGEGAFEFANGDVHWDPIDGRWEYASGTAVNYYTDARCRMWSSPGIGGADKVTFGDFNGDGRTDVLAWIVSPPGWKVCLSVGNDFSCSTWSGGPTIPGGSPDLDQQIVTGDFNGDGRTDILYLADGIAQPVLAIAGQAVPTDALTKVTTGLGAITEVVYKPLTDPSVYAKGSSANSAQFELDIQSPMNVVQSSAASTGLGGASRFTTDYFYEGLQGRTTGRGLYGFTKTRSRDGVGLVTETEYRRLEGAETYGANWSLIGRPKFVRRYAPTTAGYSADITNKAQFTGGTSLFGGNLRLVNRTTSTWKSRRSQTCGGSLCASPAAGGTNVEDPAQPLVYEAFKMVSVAESFELNGSALATTTTTSGTIDGSGNITGIDAYGNPLTVGVVTAETTGSYSKITTNTFAAADTTNWVIDRLLTSVVASTTPTGATGQRKSSFTYQGIAGASCSGATLGQICSETIEPDYVNDVGTSYSLWQQTAYTYDAFGNRASTAVKFKERDGTQVTRTSSVQYDARGRFVTSKTYPTSTLNPVTLTETKSYDTRFGIASIETNPNGAYATRLLDGFGRVYGERAFNAGGVKIAETYSPIDNITDPAQQGIQSPEAYRQRRIASGGSTEISYFDELQREVRKRAKAFINTTYAETRVVFDAAGRKVAAYKPAGSYTMTTAWTYDTLNRVASESITTSAGTLSLTSAYAYGVNASLTVDGASVGPLQSVAITQSGTGITARTNTKYTNSQGQAVRVTDGLSGNTEFSYDAYGNLVRAIGPTGIVEQMGYDRRGRKTSLSNPDSGAWTYEYNGAGELVRQVDAKSQVTRSFFDGLGRLVERREHPGSEATTPFVTVTSYDRYADTSACSNGKGKACEVRTATVARGSVGGALASPETRQVTAFDNAGRAVQGTTTFDGRTFVSTTTFDANGRVDKLQYPSGYMVVNRYTSWSGALDQVAEWTGSAVGQIHWTATAKYPDGQPGTSVVGATNLARNYDGFGRVSDITAGVGGNPISLQNAHYTFDALGNLTQRTEAVLNPATQNFGYDLVDRLTSYAGSAASYDAAGNLIARAGTSYTFQTGTHRMTQYGATGYGYDANGNVTSITGGTTRTITPNAFNLPASIVQGTTTLSYLYDAAHRRIKETSVTGSSTTTTYYLGGYEELVRTDGVTERRHWIATPDGTAGIYIARSDGSTAPRYWLTDHLGSVVGEVDQAGAIKQSATYSAWGDKLQVAQADPKAEDRGFTGHEHLAEVNLVHMNGRIYDPLTGRFLAADPLIQDPFDGQSYNRYGYVKNNPLSYTDPSGFSWWTKWRKPVIAIAVAAITMGAATWAMGAYALEVGASTSFATLAGATETGTVLTGFGNATAAIAGGFAAGGVSGGNIESAVAGAVSAGAFFAAGSAAAGLASGGNSAFAAGGIGKVALHAVAGCVSGAAAGGSCKQQAAAGAFSELAGPYLGDGRNAAYSVVAHAVVGGVASMSAGGRFENGAITGAFGYLFNYCAHMSPGCAAEWAMNAIKAGSGFVQTMVGVGLCSTVAGCVLGAPVAVVGANQVIEGATYFRQENIDGFNFLKGQFQSAAVAMGASERAGASAYHASELATSLIALGAPVTATTGWVSYGTRDPMTRQFGDISYQAYRYEVMPKVLLTGSVFGSSYRLYETLRPNAQ
ncbi:MAG: Ig-like domain-containing protein [Burkholderiales bacterium]